MTFTVNASPEATQRVDPAQVLAARRAAFKKKLARQVVPDAWAAYGLDLESNADVLGNRTAREGCSRCQCGCKYWEHDRCVDCGTLHNPVDHDTEE